MNCDIVRMATVVLNSVNEGFCAMRAFLRVKSGVFAGVGSSYTLTVTVTVSS